MSDDAERRLQEASDRIKARSAAPAGGPSPVGDVFGPIEERTVRCQCGRNDITQARTAPLPWLPKLCEQCRLESVNKREHDEHRAAMDRHHFRCEKALERLAVPPLYRDVSFATWQLHGTKAEQEVQARNHQIAVRYAGQWPVVERLVVFAGGFGTGKGHLAWSIAKAIAGATGDIVRVAKLAAVIRDLRMAWRDKDGPSEDERLRAYREPALLILDEASKHALYGAPTQHLYDIVDDRLEQDKPTIITTNESDAGLAELLGPALLDRVQGSGGLLDFGNASWRARPRAAA